MSRLLKFVRLALVVLIVAGITVYLVRAFDARNLPELGPEHRIHFANEFTAADEAAANWERYIAREDALQRELQKKIGSDDRIGFLLDRYDKDSITNPDRYDGNWNHSYELRAANTEGIAVMLHGLTDSPYSMLTTAQAIVGSGYDVVVPRLPGHGFAVSGLLQAEWEDWAAAVRIAVRSAMEIRQPGQPLLLVGYSNGGLLAINYALQCIDDDALPCPDRIVLLSPAIAVSNAGLLANLHPGLSWLPYFEQFKWLSVLPEIDPFKFNSFPKKAAWEIRRGATITERLLGNSRRVAALPPVLTFQSIVDRTVVADGLVSRLYRRLPRNGSELVIYDVNRNISLLQLMTRVPVDPLTTFESIAPLDYSVHIVRNVASDTLDVELATLNAGIERFSFTDTGMQWPLGVFSLSHIAIPFAPFDTLYGDGSNTGATGSNLVLGALAPRGELGVLAMSPEYFLRTRYNPFFAFQVHHLRDWLADDAH